VEIIVDRSLPVTIAAQVQGQIEYGVAFGTIAPGSRLPSVRDLAQRLDVSPVTISHVYKALSERGVLLTKPGSGTYVREDPVLGDGLAQRLLTLRTMVDSLVQSAISYGISRAELKRIVGMHLDASQVDARPLRLVFVGNFPEATRDYVRALNPYVESFLAPGDTIMALTIDELRRSPAAVAALHSADVTITLAHRIPEVRRYVAEDARITVLDFIPSESTRTALAELAPGTRVGLVSTYPQFLTPLKLRVVAFAPHVEVANAIVADAPTLDELVESSDVVVFTTGADKVVRRLPQHLHRIEFRYVPDPRSVQVSLVALLEALRAPGGALQHTTVPARPEGGDQLHDDGPGKRSSSVRGVDVRTSIPPPQTTTLSE
jgi:DNA-binding transcriptional regulator YhcF (GntR family)